MVGFKIRPVALLLLVITPVNVGLLTRPTVIELPSATDWAAALVPFTSTLLVAAVESSVIVLLASLALVTAAFAIVSVPLVSVASPLNVENTGVPPVLGTWRN